MFGRKEIEPQYENVELQEDAQAERQIPGYWQPGNTVELIKEFINDPNLPIQMRKELGMYFGMISRHLLFANLTEKDEVIFMRMFFNLRDRFYNGMPSFAITDQQVLIMDNLQMIFRAILTRGKGPARERILQSTQSKAWNIFYVFGGN